MALPNLILTDPTLTPLPPLAESKRRTFRPPVMPGARERWRLGSVISMLIHIGILWLILRETDYAGLVTPIEQGAGGPGPAGGGGGRTGAKMEIIQYVEVLPAPPPAPKPTLVFKPPEITPPPPVTVEPLKLQPLATPGPVASGLSTDAVGGAGPGTGGGIGTGVGTGTGASVGPGTGGGNQANYPPQPTEMFIPPLPVPAPLRGRSILAEFDVDERGRVVGLNFSATGDRGYDRRLTDVLKGYRFRPGHRPDGTPIRMKAQIKIEL